MRGESKKNSYRRMLSRESAPPSPSWYSTTFILRKGTRMHDGNF
jgi:hypothetical protein